MPHYTPVDPNLVAFHPEQIADGVLKAFQVANEDEKLRAFKHLNEEIQALRQDRMAAAKARFNTDVTRDQNLTAVSPTTNQATIAGNLGSIQVIPKQTEATLASLDETIGLAPGKKALAIGTQNAQLASAEDTNNAIQNNAAVASRKSADAVDNMDATSEATRVGLTAQIANAQLAAAKAESDLVSMPGDKKAASALQEARTNLANAQADQARAHSLFYANGGARNEQLMRDLDKNDAGINRMLREPVIMPDGAKGTLADYINTVHVNGGKEIQQEGSWWWKAPKATNPEAEALMEQLRTRYQMREKLLKQADEKVEEKTSPKASDSARITIPTKPVPGAAPSIQKAPEVKYSPDGKAWTRDANGKVVPYIP